MNIVEFTKEMKSTHKILAPNMLEVHFNMLKKVFEWEGYDLEILKDTGADVVSEGLKYVHNDTCYPALLTTGQMISALKSGKYDLDKVALLMTQTGGGCRASNYIHLIRKGIKAAGLAHIPVISVSTSGMEHHSGFQISLGMLRRVVSTMVYGDLMMSLKNQTKPYEVNLGETDKLVEFWTNEICEMYEKNKGFRKHEIRKISARIVKSFEDISQTGVKKAKVGVVGEIYVKYSPLANNNLEDFLASQDCEVNVPGIMGFLLYCMRNPSEDVTRYGGTLYQKAKGNFLFWYVQKYEKLILNAFAGSKYQAPSSFFHLQKLVKPFLSTGCKMGEGWLLTAEMIELIESGYENIVCAQPFGCLPNHIVGKGMIRKITASYPNANIVSIDYDPGATKVNQENRIKLMLSVAKERIEG